MLQPDPRPGAAELSGGGGTVMDPQTGSKISSLSRPGLGPAKSIHLGWWQSCSKKEPMLGAAKYLGGVCPGSCHGDHRVEGSWVRPGQVGSAEGLLDPEGGCVSELGEVWGFKGRTCLLG